jgi:hypothetical protein
MYRAMMDPRWGHKWRYRGQTPSPAEFEASLFHGAFSQYVVTSTATGAIVGLVTAYDARLDSGFCHLSLTRLVESRPEEPLLFLGGAALFVSLLFRNWNFRKVYAEIPGVTWRQFSAGAGTIFDVEAVIPERDYFDGEYLDARVVSISRARWQEFTGRFGRLLA